MVSRPALLSNRMSIARIVTGMAALGHCRDGG
jgi:hypothetical protein